MARSKSHDHPFGDLIGLVIDEAAAGRCRCHLEVRRHHHNPHRVVHGGVLCALADTSMGAALYTMLDEGQTCATIELKINFLQPARAGRLACETELVRRGRSTAVLEARITQEGELVAIALSTYAIIPGGR